MGWRACKGKGSGLQSDIEFETYQPTLHFTPWSLDLFIRVSFKLHGELTVPQPFWRIELIIQIAIFVLGGVCLFWE